MSPRDLRHELEQADLAMRDSEYVARVMPLLGRLTRLWFRSEVRGMGRVPDEGGALIVSNHSGGSLSMDVPILAAAFVAEFGADRPLYVLAHDRFFGGLADPVMRRCGFLSPADGRADAVLAAEGVTVVFPGGDHDAFRPSTASSTVDFDGSTDYVRTALDHGVPIVPVVSLGGQESELHLLRGDAIARLLRLDRLLGRSYLPISVGLPFGVLASLPFLPPNVPLPTKIVTQVLDPIDPGELLAELGDGASVEAVDEEVRTRMQACLDELALERRFPVIG